MNTSLRARALVAEYGGFTLNRLREVREGANSHLEAVTSVAQAIEPVESIDSHVVITVLN